MAEGDGVGAETGTSATHDSAELGGVDASLASAPPTTVTAAIPGPSSQVSAHHSHPPTNSLYNNSHNTTHTGHGAHVHMEEHQQPFALSLHAPQPAVSAGTSSHATASHDDHHINVVDPEPKHSAFTNHDLHMNTMLASHDTPPLHTCLPKPELTRAPLRNEIHERDISATSVGLGSKEHTTKGLHGGEDDDDDDDDNYGNHCHGDDGDDRADDDDDDDNHDDDDDDDHDNHDDDDDNDDLDHYSVGYSCDRSKTLHTNNVKGGMKKQHSKNRHTNKKPPRVFAHHVPRPVPEASSSPHPLPQQLSSFDAPSAIGNMPVQEGSEAPTNIVTGLFDMISATSRFMHQLRQVFGAFPAGTPPPTKAAKKGRAPKKVTTAQRKDLRKLLDESLAANKRNEHGAKQDK
ncbi:hypothetical protein PTSG_09669 [Salpingoeca rosetta]|uniref:Uncharacterized protein n=1 Tax=Salpingoeca rosetta (strain ATCC 50818 / BSB-021) TaxID=946362 RepID=F2ULN3_SALR5|nr:uncharacterized protein PTSG_09669 [Salpingoeca rosetta]EGD78032.1 hypothetical protein PTSG_09669 [Salpingoeca rosetta]|eukprot:XP_004990094.1 hypothetical protein PTSG_09669 [Salpingoeca rosetta]